MEQLPIHFLYPAAMFIDKTPHKVHTILGSCVAVCLYDPVMRIGGINHYMLPYWNGQGLASPKYGNIAIDRLVEKMLSFGCLKVNLKAKVFGGGEVIETINNQFQIGERNIMVARDLLRDHGIVTIGSSVGGKLGRKIEFDTHTGEVRMRFIEKQVITLNNK
ncbi:MAG TPA: chemotaxis protein CheD [Williamwhitmania sp.]|nr:chemotaxis protein CheD [Williamwhitmania sp.]